MNRSLVIAVVQEATRRYGQQDHRIVTRLGTVFHAAEGCEGLASLKPGVMAIFYLTPKETSSSRLAPKDWCVSKMQLHPTSEDICKALLSFGKS